MKLSIVATLYCSAPYLDAFHARASAAARALAGDDHEIVLVNDGSPDDSLARARALVDADPRVVLVDLSRNFGHHKAMMTGLAHARGERVFLIDSDLEEEPEWLPDFAARLDATGGDVVYGVQGGARKGGWFERWTGGWYYRLFKLLAGMELPANMVTARLMSRRYVDALVAHDEREIDIGGLWLVTGFDQHPIAVTKHSTSETTYTFARKVSLFVNTITAFTSKPLAYIFYLGVAISAVAGVVAAALLFQWLFLARAPSGWTSLVMSIWLLGGWIILFLGVIGIYLSKMFSEVKRRPYTIVRDVHRHPRAARDTQEQARHDG